MVTPAAVDAERGVLATVLSDPARLDTLRLTLDGSEFYDPRHELLWSIVCDLADAHVTPDPAAVVAELGRRRKLDRFDNGGYVASLYSLGLGTGTVSYHVAQLRDAAKVRAVQAAHTRLGQHLDAWAANGDIDTLLDQAAKQSVALSLAVDDPGADAPVAGVVTWEQFTVNADSRARWIVPGLLRVGDAVLVLGAAGSGKSMLSRQVAMCLAAGVHPFKLHRIDPVRTLLVDLENSPDQTAEESSGLLAGVRRLGDPEGRGFIWPHPEGLNLRTHADAALLERVIVQTEPQVLCMGSLYNAYRRGRDDWDTAAEDVQAVLKRLRARYGLGLWLEHHMPRGKDGAGHSGSPYGGTAWEKWPTHGRWLRRGSERGDVFLLAATFRGDRGERDLPAGLRRGGRLPWTAVYDEAELELLIEAESDTGRAS